MEAPASAYANGGILRKCCDCSDHLLGDSGSGSVSEKRDESPLLLNSLQKAARPRSTGPGAAPAATAGRAVTRATSGAGRPPTMITGPGPDAPGAGTADSTT
ncbi:hypothetical protein G3M48_009547 [Beauveria asiatica]|uniref:Uncharacterized protein n=1 Tax=Beauveria asiatica TaxID=1069075 RepID=A0AAW0RIU6_9HYPO